METPQEVGIAYKNRLKQLPIDQEMLSKSLQFFWRGPLLYPEFGIAVEIMLNVLDVHAMTQLSLDIIGV
eukprot:4858691-Ditylum_brightwellii.AAC.1